MFDLERLLKDLNLTKLQLASVLGKSASAITKVNKGEMAQYKYRVLENIVVFSLIILLYFLIFLISFD